MAQLTLSLDIDEGARDALQQFAEDKAQRAVALEIVGERIDRVGNAVPATESLSADLSALRGVIADRRSAFAFVRLDEGIHQVMVVSDGEPPKTRMLYASSNAHIRKALPCGMRQDHHITKLEALAPPLFESKSDGDVMTESEKAQQAIAQMPVAPTGSALPGMGLKVDATAEGKLEKFKNGDTRAAAFAIAGGVASGVWSTAAEDPVAAVCREVNDADPRFILLAWEAEGSTRKNVFLYLCPSSAKPRDRMAYSLCKVAFSAQLSQRGVEVAKAVELDTTEGMKAAIAESLKGGLAMEAVAPTAATMVKGPRMFFQ